MCFNVLFLIEFFTRFHQFFCAITARKVSGNFSVRRREGGEARNVRRFRCPETGCTKKNEPLIFLIVWAPIETSYFRNTTGSNDEIVPVVGFVRSALADDC